MKRQGGDRIALLAWRCRGSVWCGVPTTSAQTAATVRGRVGFVISTVLARFVPAGRARAAREGEGGHAAPGGCPARDIEKLRDELEKKPLLSVDARKENQ